MNRITTTYITTGCIVMALAVGLGAFGAHALRDIMDEYQTQIWKTGVQYHMVHGLAILALSGIVHKLGMRRASAILLLFVVGILFFSGSLYVLATCQVAWIRSISGPITPIGGLLFITGWLVLAYSARRAVNSSPSQQD